MQRNMESMETIPEETSQNLEYPDNSDCGCYPDDRGRDAGRESGIADELSVSVTLDNKDILVCPVSNGCPPQLGLHVVCGRPHSLGT